MTTASHVKPHAGKLHVRFGEGDSASAKPRREAQLANDNCSLVVRFFRRLRFMEMFLLLMSLLYGVGLLILIQHHSLFSAFDELDVIRIKPIIVGIEYVLYIIIPMAVLIIPMAIVRHVLRMFDMKANTCLRKAVTIASVLTLMGLIGGWVGVMFHYFFPYITATGTNLLAIACLFWKVYFTWSGHWFGFCLIIIGVYGLWWGRARKHCIMSGILICAGLLCNVFFFTRDVYVNISQSAAGGSPRFGLITISNPAEHIQYGAGDYDGGAVELTKPCYFLHESDEYVYIAEHFTQQETPLATLHNCMRIPRTSVSSFQELSQWSWIHEGVIQYPNQTRVTLDPVYNLSAELSVCATCTNSMASLFLRSETNGVNRSTELRLYSKEMNSNVYSTNMNVVVSTIAPAGTNVVVKFRFSHIKFPWGMCADDFIKRMKDDQCVMCIQGFPALSPQWQYRISDVSIGFNFITRISIPCYQNLELTVPSSEGCLQFVLNPWRSALYVNGPQ